MKYSFQLVMTILCLPFLLNAQSTATLKGKLIDNNLDVIPYASISLLDLEDKLIQGAISNEKGNFEFEDIAFQSYTLDIQYLGFKSIRQSVVFDKKNKKINLGNITLEEDQTQLDEVTITAEKSDYNIRLDKKVFNVGKDVLSQGGTAIEVLDQVPLVSVSPTGVVELRGSSNVQVLVNGKRSGLTMNNALDQIPGSNIERVEVITNPSASFDASGSAGIVNIILKKDKGMGWNGQLGVTVGTPANHMILPGINYKNKKFNLFSNFRWRYSDYNGDYTTKQTQTENGNTSYLDQVEDESRHDDGLSAYIGMDYYFDKYNSATLAFYRDQTKDTDETFLTYSLKDDFTTSKIIRKGNSVEKRNYNQLESNYTRSFDKKGQKFTIDFQYDFWNSDKDWDLLTEGDLDEKDIATALRTSSETGSKDIVIRSDYSHPIANGSKFDLGVKLENRIVTNEYKAESFVNEQWSIFDNTDNSLEYGEKIAAAYLQYQSKWKGFEFMVGLRSEYTMLDINDEANIFSDKDDYLNLFPSTHLSYAFSEKNTLQVSYSRRINRPSLWNLYPFTEIKDFNLQQIGNPNLQPAFSDAMELAFLSTHDKITINPAIYFRHTIDPFSTYLSQNEQGTFIFQPVNIEAKEAIGFELSLRYRPAKFLSLNAEINLFHFDERGSYLGQNLDAKGNSSSGRLTANVNLPKAIRLQARLDYYGAEQRAQTRELATKVLSLGASKSFLNNQLNINIRAFNILDSRNIRTISESDTFRIENSNKRVHERFSLGLTYKFNQSERERLRQAKNGNR